MWGLRVYLKRKRRGRSRENGNLILLKEEHSWQLRSSASSNEIQNAFSKGAFATRTATTQIGKGTIGLMKISWRNAWREETGSLPSRGRLSVYFFSFLNSMVTLLRRESTARTPASGRRIRITPTRIEANPFNPSIHSHFTSFRMRKAVMILVNKLIEGVSVSTIDP